LTDAHSSSQAVSEWNFALANIIRRKPQVNRKLSFAVIHQSWMKLCFPDANSPGTSFDKQYWRIF